MADRSLTLLFLGKDAGASRTAAELAAQLKTLDEITAKNNKTLADNDKQLSKLEQSFKNADRGMNSLLLTALELGPALIPLGAVGVGAIAGLAPAAAAAGLAFLGLKQAWKDGTLQGTQLGKQISIFQTEFEHLKTLAAGGVMPGFTKGLQEIQPLFPAINRSIALFSTQLGTIAGNVAPGIVRVFLQLQPLFQTFGDLLVQGSQKFAAWAQSGDQVKTFVAYVQTNLPAVLSTISNLVVTVSHLVQGFAPFGSTSLLAIKLFSQAINAIPVGVLQVLVPVVAGLALGMKAMKEASVAAEGLQLLSGKLGAIGGSVGKGAAGVVGSLGKAVGFLGPIGIAAGIGLGGLSVIMGNHAKAAQEAAKRTNDLAQALQDGNLHFTLYTQLVKSGAIPAADALGISQKTVYDATIRTGSGMADLRAGLAASTAKLGEMKVAQQQTATTTSDASLAYRQQQQSLIILSAGVQQAQKDYDDAKKSTAEYAKAQGDAALSADILSGKTATQAAALGVTEDAYINGKLAADKKTASDAAATAQMLLEGDAAGLLTQQLNILTDTQLGASDANLAFKLANIQLQQALVNTKGDLSTNTVAGLQNNQAVNAAIRLAEQDGEQLAKLEQKTKGATVAKADGTAKTRADLVALRDSIVAHGGDATAVNTLIGKLDNYNKLPVPPKPVHVDTHQVAPAMQAVKNSIFGVPGRTIPVTIQWIGLTGPQASAQAIKNTQGLAGATGGFIQGPGTSTSDSIPLLASTGEFMMKAAAVSKYGLGFMQNINAMKFADGGPIVLQLPSNAAVVGGAAQREAGFQTTIRKNLPAIPGGGAAVGGNVGALQAYAFSLFPSYGWGAGAQSSLVALWNGESGWNPAAYNASSGATGIPQSLPASKMASAGADYLTNGATQIRWGLSYIASVYGSPTNAYSAWLSRSPHWYGQGMPPTTFNSPTLLGVGENGPETVTVSRGSRRSYGGDIYVTVNVQGSVRSDRDLVTVIRAGIRDQLRSEGKLATVV